MNGFAKYKKRGAYHWREFKKDTAYRKNVLKIKEWIQDGLTLDVGAGDGLITSVIDAVGVDNNKLAVSLARERGINVIEGDAYNLPFDSNNFDNVLMGDVIEHLKYPEKSLLEIWRVLKDKKFLYIVTPPCGGKMDKYHYKEYSPKELVELVEDNGFKKKGSIEVRNDLRRMYGIFEKQIL